jgi:UDP-N-acetylglucosamine 2-epimerase (non-hydrolysing)
MNIRKAGDLAGEVFVTGNTALDAVRLCRKDGYQYGDPKFAAFAAHSGPRLLVTAHRRENWGEPMEDICRGLLGMLGDFPDAMLCFCWHPNPVVRETVGKMLADEKRVILCDPPRFDVFINLMADSDLILSDSGGIQEEVTQLHKYVLVLREETERPEAVESGFARVVGTSAPSIRAAAREALPKCLPRERGGTGELPPAGAGPFGDGHAAEKIVAAIRLRLG